jgi:hypothetical protein
MALTLDQLQAERKRLVAEEEALQREYGSGRGGKEFLTGAKLEDWERRSLANDKALRNVNYQIRVANEAEAARSKTAADAPQINPRADGTGTNAASNPAVEKLSDREKHALANKDIPSSDTSDDVVQGGTTVKNSTPTGPFNTNAFANQSNAPNPGGGPTFTADPSLGPQMGNKTLPGQNSEPAPDITTTNQNILNKITQSAGPTAKTGSTSDAGTSLGEKVAKQEQQEFNITPNMLHQYATYTYGLTLHALTKDSYNQLAQGKKGNGWLKDAVTLFSSGGRWGERDKNNPGAFVRPTEFKDDFYFEDFTFTTVIGLSSNGKASNAIDFTFNIVEPYGFTLINRLLLLSLKLKQPNYTENPYVLQIDFFGNTDGGDVVNPIPSITKYIPIKILAVSMKVDKQGTVYACRATPYNHQAFNQSTASTPADFEVTARTVGDFFSPGKDAIVALRKQLETKNSQREKINNINKQKERGKLTDSQEQQLKELEASYKTAIVTKSYTQAMNLHQLYLKDTGVIEVPDEIIFQIDEVIANSPIVYSEKTSVSNTAMTDPTNPQQSKAAAVAKTPAKQKATPALGPDTKFEKFNVKAGENVLGVIDKVIRASKYITSQLVDDKNTENKKDSVVNAFKVVSSVELINFDENRNVWGKRITYKIIAYRAHNYKHPDAPKTNAPTIIKDIRKKYEYIYTGENNDILDFALEFKTTWFTAVEVLQKNKQKLSNSQDNATNVKKEDKTKKGNKLPKQRTGTVQPNVLVPVVSNQQNMGFNSQQNPDVKRTSDVLQALYTDPDGDMISVKLRIVGDPDFIKQDDIYYTPNTEAYPPPDKQNSENGSILTDRGAIFCYLRFKTPVDIDLNTGGLRSLAMDKDYLESDFSGCYQIIKVENEFRQGKFEQSLDLVRVLDDEVNQAVAASIAERTGKTAATKQGKSDLNKLNSNVTVQQETKTVAKEGSYSSYSETQKAIVNTITSDRQEELTSAAGSQNSNPVKQNKLETVVAQGSTLSPDQQNRQVAFSRDGNQPITSNPTLVTAPAPSSRALSSDPEISRLQENYNLAINDESAARARLQNVENGFYDNNPAVKAKVIETNNNLLRQALLAKSDISKALALKGATPA